eukprot:s501_g10.t2
MLHAATGHGSVKSLVDVLKRRNAHPEIIQMAKDFKCSVCEEKSRVKPRHLSSLEALPPKWHTASADIGHWRHPTTGEHVQFMVIIDEGSRFRVAKVLSKGQKQQPGTATCLQYLREGWGAYFGLPRTLRLDPAGAFRSQGVVDFCDEENIFLDIVPADAHWQIGVCEQAVQGIKEVMSKLCADDDQLSPEEAVAMAVTVFNHREHIRGFSPIQHAFGRSPDVTGRIIPSCVSVPDDLIVESATSEFERSAKLRLAAEKAHAEWHAAQRISRAVNSRARPKHSYQPGELVYFWRSQESGQGRRQPGNKGGRFLGPARILAVEAKREPDGSLRSGSAVWCIRGRQLLKCCPEQLRPASEREELLEAVAREHGEEPTPWTFTRLASEIGGGGTQYEDVSQHKPTEAEWVRAQNPEEEDPPRRFRLRGKRMEPEPVAPEDDQDMTPSASSAGPRGPRARIGPRDPLQGAEMAETWHNHVHEQAWAAEATDFWESQDAAVEVEVELPQNARNWEKAVRNLPAYFTGALKRQIIEVSEKRLTAAEREQFRDAKMIEVRNFLAAQAFEALPRHLQPSRSQAIGMRWVLTWKTKDTGEVKAKARAVLLGYQDPCYEHRATTAPVLTRQTRQMLLQVAANHSWSVYKGDVSGAFLQGREYPGTLFCVPCDEICDSMKIPRGSITKLKRACYGLVDAPLEWYKTVSEFFESLGLERLWSDACAWVWRPEGKIQAMISDHVDDFLFSGNEENPGWLDIVRKIKERFQWGDWDKDEFVQCGVKVSRKGKGFVLSQEKYVSEIPEIPINSSRRKEQGSATTGWEKTQLRGLLGALSWHAQQVAPHISAEVGILLSEVNTSVVRHLVQANQLLQSTKARKDHQMLIHSFGPSVELGMFAWVDAASQNRHDGGSTQGIFIGAAPTALLKGEVCPITPISWHSHKIDRVCRSPGAAETQAAVNGEDQLCFARYQRSEIMFGSVLSIKGAEKRANLALLALKESQHRTEVHIRWVHSEAQLSNTLTKANGGREMELYYRMGHQWRIVEDERMRSARKRKAEGLSPLQQQDKQVFWMVDIPLHFFFGVQLEGTTELRPQKLAQLYLRSWFLVDLVVVLIDWMLFLLEAAVMSSDETSVLKSARYLRTLRLLRLFRLLRVVKLYRELSLLANRFLSTYAYMVMKVVAGLCVMLAINHLIACAWYGIGSWNPGKDLGFMVWDLQKRAHEDVVAARAREERRIAEVRAAAESRARELEAKMRSEANMRDAHLLERQRLMEDALYANGREKAEAIDQAQRHLACMEQELQTSKDQADALYAEKEARLKEFQETARKNTDEVVKHHKELLDLERALHNRSMERTMDRTVLTWGYLGGEEASTPEQLRNVDKVEGAAEAFAALRTDGSVLTWGSPQWIEGPCLQPDVQNVKEILATGGAFAAKIEDGSTVLWGAYMREELEALGFRSRLRDLQDLEATAHSMAARLADGTVLSWGRNELGLILQKELSEKATQMKATERAFAAALSSGSVVTWGDADYGGDSEHVQERLHDVWHLQASAAAFAALRSDGTVVTWGHARFGGDSADVQSQQIHVAFPSGRGERLSIPESSNVGDLRTLAQEAFGQGFVKLVTASGVVLSDATESLQAAGLEDGDHVTALAVEPIFFLHLRRLLPCASAEEIGWSHGANRLKAGTVLQSRAISEVSSRSQRRTVLLPQCWKMDLL